jgi:hypothetical protein
MIGKDSPVMVTDAFVDKLDLSKLGFQTLSCGQPPQSLYAKQRPFYKVEIHIFGCLTNMMAQISDKLDAICYSNSSLTFR